MRVREIIRAHAQDAGYRAQFAALLASKGLKKSDLAVGLYGRDVYGRARQTGKVSGYLNEFHRLRYDMLERWAQVIGVDVAELERIQESAKAELGEAKPMRRSPRTPAQEEPQRIVTVAPAYSRVYNLAISADGTADLTMNLQGLTIDHALKITLLLQELGAISRK